MTNGNGNFSMADLEPGESGVILSIRSGSPFRKRLVDLGFIKGVRVEKLKLAPLADPAEYLVRGAHISLRENEARDILLESTE